MVVLTTVRETVVGMNRDCFLPNRVPLRPQPDIQTNFESRNGLRGRPYVAQEHVGDCSVAQPAASGNVSLAEVVVVHESVQVRAKLLCPHVRAISDVGVNWPVLVKSSWRVGTLGHTATVFGDGRVAGPVEASGVTA